jgi:hypothetical protein
MAFECDCMTVAKHRVVMCNGNMAPLQGCAALA